VRWTARSDDLGISSPGIPDVDPWIGLGVQYMADTQIYIGPVMTTDGAQIGDWTLEHYGVAVPITVGVAYTVAKMFSGACAKVSGWNASSVSFCAKREREQARDQRHGLWRVVVRVELATHRSADVKRHGSIAVVQKRRTYVNRAPAIRRGHFGLRLPGELSRLHAEAMVRRDRCGYRLSRNHGHGSNGMLHAGPMRMRTNPISRSTRRQTAAFAVVAVALIAACSHSSSKETTAAKLNSERADAYKKLEQSTDAVADLSGRIPDSVARDAKCIVVVPNLVKAGFVVGGQGGSGYATCRTSNGKWSAPAPIHIAGGSVGAQIGGQTTELVALVKTDKGMKALQSGNFKVGVDASASAGPVGTGRSSSTDISEGGDLVSYGRSKGLYAGANLDGTTISTDDDAMKAMYGSEHDLKSVLSGDVPAHTDTHSQRFLNVAQTGFGPGRQ